MIKPEIKELFIECFPDTIKEADIILEYVEKHGRIHCEYSSDTLVNIICTSSVNDKSVYFEYIFACGTKKEARGRGIFKRKLLEVIGNKPALLIPENDSLIPMYESLGFTPIYCIKADFGVRKSYSVQEIGIEELYNAYTQSACLPKKNFSLFEASMRAFLSYGNKILREENGFLLMEGETATEIFAKSKEEMLLLARGCKSALLPLCLEDEIKQLNIPHSKKCFAMAKGIKHENFDDFYINNLFN